MEKDFNVEELRQQMQTLKKMLNKQKIVNDRMVRRAVKKNVVDLNKRYFIITLLGLLMIPYGYWAFVIKATMSIGFYIVCCLGMLASVVYTYRNGKALRSSKMLEGDLVEACRTIERAKKRDHNWLKFGIPFTLLFLAYFAYEGYRFYSEAYGEAKGTRMVIVGIVCGLLGIAVGIKQHFTTQRKYKEIIDQIKDLE